MITNIAPNDEPKTLPAIPPSINSNNGEKPIDTANAIISNAIRVTQPCFLVSLIFFSLEIILFSFLNMC